MNGRTELTRILTEELSGWQIVSDSRQLDAVRKPGAVVLWSQRLIRPELNRLSLLQEELVLWVLTATDHPLYVQDDLDALLTQVLQVLEAQDGFIWTEAENGVLAEKFRGWRMTITCNYVIEKDN